jgi:23S rRNA (guanosine2251-2'-O)-methyltransferase
MPKSDLIFGIHAVLSALRNDPVNVREVQVDRHRRDSRMREVRTLATSQHIALHEVDSAALNKLAAGQRHQGVIAFYVAVPTFDESRLTTLIANSARPLVLVLDGITDPHNLGAILRTAEAAGVTAIVAPRDRAAKINPTVRKVACGAAERVVFVPVTNLARALRDMRQLGVWLVGTDSRAKQPLYELDLSRPLAIVVGAEGAGLRRLTRELCDFLAYIPMAATAQSLNVSVAAGVCLFEVARQRRARINAQ